MENIYKLAFIAVMATAATSCCSNAENSETENKPIPATVKPDWAEGAVIYEVNWRQATDDGKLTTFTSENLPKLKELGVDILWFMPINPISELKRKGKIGSYYASQN